MDNVIKDVLRSQEALNEAGSKSIETMTLWAQTNQCVLDALLDLSAGTAKEVVQLYGHLQRRSIDAVRDGQAAILGWQSAWKEAPADPATWCQKALAEGVSNAQKVFRLVEENTQACARAAERLQATAEQAGKGVQQAVADAVTRTKEIYSRN